MPSQSSNYLQNLKQRIHIRKLQKLPRLLMFAGCVLGFLWQITNAIHTYLCYETISQFQMADPKRYHLPAMTMCQQPFVSRALLAELYPESKFESEAEMEALIRKAVEEKPIESLFGHKYNFEEGQHRCELNLLTDQFYHKNGSLKLASGTTGQRPCCNSITQPLESLLVYGLPSMYKKCFTYFSKLNLDPTKLNLTREQFLHYYQVSEYRALEYRGHDISNLVAEFFVYKLSDGSQLDPKRYQAVSYEKRPFFAIHDSASIHTQEEFQEFEMDPNHWYKIFFRRVESYLLKAPYRTDCVIYDLGNPGAVQSRDDCYIRCLLRHYRKNCGCIPEIEANYRMNQLLPDDRFCRQGAACHNDDDVIEHCDQSCRPPCKEVFFEFSAKIYESTYRVGRITVVRRNVPEIVYTHIPALNWIQFLCNIGSICGMWLGVSFLNLDKQFAWIFSAGKKVRPVSKRTPETLTKREIAVQHNNEAMRWAGRSAGTTRRYHFNYNPAVVWPHSN